MSAPARWPSRPSLPANHRAAPPDGVWVTYPYPRDLVRHFAFGLCEVLQYTGDRLKLRDMHGPGRIREIVLDMLDISPPTEANGKRTFKLSRKA